MSRIAHIYTQPSYHGTLSTILLLPLMFLHLLYWLYFKKRGVSPLYTHTHTYSLYLHPSEHTTRASSFDFFASSRFSLILLSPPIRLSFFLFLYLDYFTTPKRKLMPMCNRNSFITTKTSNWNTGTYLLSELWILQEGRNIASVLSSTLSPSLSDTNIMMECRYFWILPFQL